MRTNVPGTPWWSWLVAASCRVAGVVVVAAGGCVYDVPLEDKQCDAERGCVPGFVCVDDLCVAEGEGEGECEDLFVDEFDDGELLPTFDVFNDGAGVVVETLGHASITTPDDAPFVFAGIFSVSFFDLSDAAVTWTMDAAPDDPLTQVFFEVRGDDVDEDPSNDDVVSVAFDSGDVLLRVRVDDVETIASDTLPPVAGDVRLRLDVTNAAAVFELAPAGEGFSEVLRIDVPLPFVTDVRLNFGAAPVGEIPGETVLWERVVVTPLACLEQ